MVLDIDHDNLFFTYGTDEETGKDVSLEVDNVLESICSNKLAGRIIDAALLAAAEEMLQEAQAMRSSVEAENSTNMG